MTRRSNNSKWCSIREIRSWPEMSTSLNVVLRSMDIIALLRNLCFAAYKGFGISKAVSIMFLCLSNSVLLRL